MGLEWWVCCWSLLLVQGLLLCCHGHGCWEEERLALLRLQPSFRLLDWDRYGPRSDCCNWDSNMISCDYATGRVTDLHLPYSTGLDYWNSNGFERLSSLRSLETLDLSENHFDNSVLASLRHLSSLRSLYLSRNWLNGSLHAHGFQRLSSLRNLETLYLSDNRFDNSVLASMQHLSSLKFLDLSRNRLNGSLHVHGINSLKRLTDLDLSDNSIESFQASEGDGILNLTNLENLELFGNLFNSSVLSFFRGLSSLKRLSLQNNRFERSIHVKEFDGLNNLEELYLWNNSIKSFVDSKDDKVLEKLKTLDLTNVSARGSNLLQFAGLFPSITTLYLSGNTFSDSIIGKGLCGLSNLHNLDMSFSELNGNLPACFSNLTALEYLDLSYNHLSGDLSFSPLGALNSIQYLDLSGNQFRVPSSLSPFLNLSKLQHFVASDNEIYADMESNNSVPTFQLKSLYLSGHGLGGGFPEFLYHQHELEEVRLSNINFSGQHFPTWLLENNPKLEGIYLTNASLSGSLKLPAHPHQRLSDLDISDNLLIGCIPREIGAFFPMLIELNISNNQLTGSIPSSIGDMKRLKFLYLSNNKLSGERPTSLAEGFQGDIPPSLQNMTRLETTMPNNTLEGPFREQLFNLPFLEILDLSGNLISGTIPSGFNLPSINHIHLSKNRLQGRLPISLCKSTGLITLDLSNNLLVDAIPRCIAELHELSYLILRNNRIKGKIPLEICKLTKLSLVDLSYNNLSGSIPSCLSITTLDDGPISTGVVAPIASSEDVEFKTKSMTYSYWGQMLILLSGIDLSCNKFTGSIPEEIGRLNKIYILNLSHNSLTRGIPFTISNLSRVESLDLSFNNLHGGIPPEIVDLTFLSSFNVSFNNLSGHTPKRVKQFATFEENSYKGNPFLCGEPLASCNVVGPLFRNPMGSAHEIEDGGLMDMGVFYISLITSYVTSLLAVLLVLWINPYWRRKWFYYVDKTTTSCYYYVVDHLPKCF